MIELLKLKISLLLRNRYQLINLTVQEPKDYSQGDIAIPLFQMAKVYQRSILVLSEEIKQEIWSSEFNEYIRDFNIVNGYLNLYLNKIMVAKDVIQNDYLTIANHKIVVIDYSSPNIAKPFSIGHLRSTIIGNALANIYQKVGFKVIRINHLGDYGTQFGKLIVAYKKWGKDDAILNNPINELVKLYVKFNKLAENSQELQQEGRDVFKKLEDGDEEYLSLWKWFKSESVKEFQKMYDLLGVQFDYYHGEAFYNDKMTSVIEELEKKSLLKFNDGAYIVELGNLTPALIIKSDGTSLYITRDLATLFYRKQTFNFDKVLYVVGNEQSLHFEQLKAVVERMGYPFAKDIYHVSFGLMLQNGKKMSTRKGSIVKLIDVLNEAVEVAHNLIKEKNRDLENQEEIAKAVGISAVIFNDLKNKQKNDIEFNLEQMCQFEGLTGPYLQYTSVRINSLLKVSTLESDKLDYQLFEQPHYFEIIRLLDKYKLNLEKVTVDNDVSHLSKYLLKVAKIYNSFYGIEKIIVSDEEKRNTNLLLSYKVKNVLDEGIQLLGMKVIEKM